MNYQEIQDALRKIAETSALLEEAYIENGGEVTEVTENYEEYKASLMGLLAGEGVDSLGRWLKSKEDEKATYQAEKEAADRRIKSVERTIDFIKQEIGHILRVTGKDVAKGTFYTFKATDATKTGINGELLADRYGDIAEKALREAGIPPYVGFKLGATVKAVEGWSAGHDGEGSDLLVRETHLSATFLKPRKKNEEKE